MINIIDRALERYLREQVPLPESTIGMSFDPPNKDWGAGLNRPTVNVFLWDVSRAAKSSVSGLGERITDHGIERRPANPEVDLHYLVTAWATEVRDEHQVLGAVMTTILRSGTFPEEMLPAGTIDGTLRLALEPPEHRTPGELWSALGGSIKPGLHLRVTIPVPVNEWVPAAQPPTSLDLDVQPVWERPLEDGAANGSAPSQEGITWRTRRNGAVSSEGRQLPQSPSTPDGSRPC